MGGLPTDAEARKSGGNSYCTLPAVPPYGSSDESPLKSFISKIYLYVRYFMVHNLADIIDPTSESQSEQ
jgi:hypothetical protein